MTKRDPKEQLTGFLEQHAFQPVLRAKQDSVPAAKWDDLKDLQERTQTEIERFRSYASAEEVVTNFNRDLHSSKAKEIHRRLKALELPALPDVRKEFGALVERLGIKGGHD
jgi:hypothetical protein